jgi:hypothetical protein
METTAINQNCIHEEIKSRLNYENAQKPLSSHPLYGNVKIKVLQQAINLPVIYMT